MHPFRTSDFQVHRNHLKVVVEFQLGFRLATLSDCQKASEVMRLKRITISAHTLARFFGIIGRQIQPYKATLDLLSQYCGFKNFDHFVKMYSSNELEDSSGLRSSFNSNNGEIERALKIAFQAFDEESIHLLLEQIDENDPFHFWLMHTASYLYSLPQKHTLLLLEILAKSKAGRKYFYEQYINENDPNGVFSEALMKYYMPAKQESQAKIFSQLFISSLYVYRDRQIDLKDIQREVTKAQKTLNEELGFHLQSRMMEFKILNTSIGPRDAKKFCKTIADHTLLAVEHFNRFEQMWYLYRITRAMSHKGLLFEFLSQYELREQLEMLYLSQKELISTVPLLFIQACLHYYWGRKKIEHNFAFNLCHPYVAQNESNTILVLEAFGIALYDESVVGQSIKRNLPKIHASSGTAWMKNFFEVLK